MVTKRIIIGIAIVVVGALFALYFNIGKTHGEMLLTNQSYIEFQRNQITNLFDTISYPATSSVYDRINYENDIEHGLITYEGDSVLTEDEYNQIKQELNYAFIKSMNIYAKKLFGKTTWDERMLNQMKEDLTKVSYNKYLLNAPNAKWIDDNLKFINDYYSAKNLIYRAKQCTEIDNIDRLVAQAKNFRSKPLSNNSSLQSELNKVGNYAKDNVVRIIKNRITSAINYVTQYNEISPNSQAAEDSYYKYKRKYGSRKDIEDLIRDLHILNYLNYMRSNNSD